jgi:hypothetical protein
MTAAQLAEHKSHVDFQAHQMAALREIDAKIHASVPPALIAELEGPFHDLEASSQQIVEHIKAAHAVAQRSYLNALQAYLNQPFSGAASFDRAIQELRRIHSIFEFVNQTFSDFAKSSHLMALFGGIPPLRKIMDDFHDTNRLLNVPAFGPLVTLLAAKAKDIAPKEASAMGFTALGASSMPPRPAYSAKQDPPNRPRDTRQDSPARPYDRDRDRRRNDRRRSSSPRAAPTNYRRGTPSWCHYHGDCKHPPTECSMRHEVGFEVTATKANPMGGPTAPWLQRNTRT